MNDESGVVLGVLERAGKWLEDGLLVLLLFALIVLACTQIVLRNGFGTGLMWADELLRLLLLWLALIGAVAASRDHKQIAIDVMSRFLPNRWLRWVELVTNLFTAVVTAVLCYYSAVFVAQSREFEDVVLGDWPAWGFQAILPVAFALMTYRYGLRTFKALLDKL